MSASSSSNNQPFKPSLSISATHNVVWLDPTIYNAPRQNYTSIEAATRAYTQEKQQIISCYERQLQRLLSQFSIALKQIEYLEDYRKQQNLRSKFSASSSSSTSSHSASIFSLSSSPTSLPLPAPTNHHRLPPHHRHLDNELIIEQLNRKIRIMHEEMVSMKNLYTQKIDVILEQKAAEIDNLKNAMFNPMYEDSPSPSPAAALHHDDDDDNVVEDDDAKKPELNLNETSSIRKQQHLRNRSIPNTPSNWVPEKVAHSVEDSTTYRLQRMEREYESLRSEYETSLKEIENLRIQIESNDHKIQEIDQGDQTPVTSREHIQKLRDENTALQQQLKSAQIAQRLFLKRQKDEGYLKAKKKIIEKEQKQIKEEEFKLQLEEVQLNKDIVIHRLAEEYHDLQDKEMAHERQVQELHGRMQEMAKTHEQQVSLLKEEYVSRIHYHRQQIQEYLNNFLMNQQQSKSNKRRESLLYADDVKLDNEEEQEEDARMEHSQEDSMSHSNSKKEKFFNLSITSPQNSNSQSAHKSGGNNAYLSMSFSHSHESSDSITHSRDESDMSQISQSADEIVTSLVLGIDEKLDEILTPVQPPLHTTYVSMDLFGITADDNDTDKADHGGHNHLETDSFTYLGSYDDVTPRGSGHHAYQVSNESAEFNEDPPEPEPSQIDFGKLNLSEKNSKSPSGGGAVSGTRKGLHLGPQSNASLLFAKPMIAFIVNDSVQNKMKQNTHEELAEQCLEYEDTCNRYEKEIEDLRNSLDDMLKKSEESETEIKRLKDQNRKFKRREFDWVAKENEYKSLLAQYRELRENNAKLTLTYFTLQCQYDKLKRDYDEKSAMIMNYGDYQIHLTNQMISNDNTSSNNSSNRNVLMLSNNNSNNEAEKVSELTNINPLSPLNTAMDGMGLSGMGDLDILSDISNEDDEVDMVVGFMSSGAGQRNTRLMNVNDISATATSPTGNALDVHQHAKQQLSAFSVQSHGYNMSYFGNNLAFQYTAKTKDELIEEVLKLRDKLSEMTDSKLALLQSTTQQIRRLESKVKMLDNPRNKPANHSDPHYFQNNIQEIQLDQQITKNQNDANNKDRKQRKSFGGGTIGIMNSDDHSYTVSKNDLDSVAKQLISKQHKRAESMANQKYLLPTIPKTVLISDEDEDNKGKFDENHSDDEENRGKTQTDDHEHNDNDNKAQQHDDVNTNTNEEEETDQVRANGHFKSLTFLHNATSSDDLKID